MLLFKALVEVKMIILLMLNSSLSRPKVNGTPRKNEFPHSCDSNSLQKCLICWILASPNFTILLILKFGS